jgi:hypothetical protein
MTADQLSDMLVARLVRDHGGAKHAWRQRIGPVRLYSVATHPHCNWAIDPTGSIAQIAAIEQLMDELRLRHPVLAPSA